MITKPIRVLLVEDNPGDARLIKEMLAEAEGQDFSIEWVSRLADGLERLGRDKIDVVLLDLGLPDSQGLDTFIKAREQAPQVPFVVLTGLSDENLALTALRQGAQDYLFKDETHPNLILRAIRYATERKQAELALEAERNKFYGVLNALPAFVHLKDANLSIRFANRRFTECFGEPGHKHCYELLRGRSEPCENCSALRVLKNKTPDKGEWTDSLRGRTFEVYNYPFCSDNELLVLTLGIDITERKQAEEAVRDHEEQLRTIYENAPLIMMLVDAERRVRMANKMAEECAGADEADLIGRRGGEALRCLHSLDDPEGCGFGPDCQVCRVRCTVIDTLETGESHHQVEATLPFLIDGEPRDITFLLSTARLAVRGEPQALITIQDITKRKLTEEALRQSEARLLLAQQAAKIGTFEHNLQTGIITWTPELEEMYGLAPGSFSGTLEAFINLLHPDDRGKTVRLIEECLKTGGQSEGEWRVIWPDGSSHWLYGRWQCFKNKLGQPAIVSGVNIDITKRKETEEALRKSEEHYRSLFDNMLNGFAYCKMLFENGQPCDFIYLNVNQAFETLSGLKNVVGKRVSEVVPGIREADSELFAIYGRVALTGKPESFEIYVSALEKWFSITAYSPEKEYFVSVFDEITERKRAEEALRQSEENLRYMASQLLHAQEGERLRIAHELHDDLGQSLLLLKLQLGIMSRGLPPELQKSRQECAASIDNVQEIIDSVRRLSQDLIPPTLSEIGLKSAIKDLLEEFCHHQGIDCSVDVDEIKGLFPPDTELIIYRIIQESLTNIGKYAQATQISISLKRTDHQACLSVEDKGLGFDLERILARRGRKRGLGLASMEERARMLGGTLQITSTPNVGTKIQVTVPLKR